MRTIKLRPLWHRGGHNIAVEGSLDGNLMRVIRNNKNFIYSRTHRCWYVIVPQAFKVNSNDEPFRHQLTALPAGYSEMLIRMRYSESTKSNYESQLRKFIEYIAPTAIEHTLPGIM